MDHETLRGLIGAVSSGRMSRRGFVRRLAAVGLTAPMATQLLAMAGAASAQAETLFSYTPTRRGGGGQLKIL